jgi:hypothetical protein
MQLEMDRLQNFEVKEMGSSLGQDGLGHVPGPLYRIIVLCAAEKDQSSRVKVAVKDRRTFVRAVVYDKSSFLAKSTTTTHNGGYGNNSTLGNNGNGDSPR